MKGKFLEWYMKMEVLIYFKKNDKYMGEYFLSNGIHTNGEKIIFIVDTFCFKKAKDLFKGRKRPYIDYLWSRE